MVLDLLETLAELPAECWLIPPVLILAVIFAVMLLQRQSLLRAWEDIAAHTGLRVRPGFIVNPPDIVGEYRGRPLAMTIVSRRPETWRRGDWTRVILKAQNPTYLRFRLFRQGFVETIAGSLFDDIPIGEDAFDRRFVVQSDEPEAARALLADPELRRALIQTDVRRIELHSDDIWACYGSVERDPTRADRIFTSLSDLADRLAGLQPVDRREIIG